jgi:hypothetical protein
MSPEELAAYRASHLPTLEAEIDAAMIKLYGRTYRFDEEDRHMAAALATRPPSARTSDGFNHPPDSWQHIKADFPTLFGEDT